MLLPFYIWWAFIFCVSMEHHALFRFYEELNDFLPQTRRKVDFLFGFIGTVSIKDAIESLGVPHVEVDLILVNGEPAGFDYRLGDGDRVSVYPVFESLDIKNVSLLRPAPLRNPAFVLDVHLGRLAKLLRLLGFDCRYSNTATDIEIAVVSRNDNRIVLTRDIGLLKVGAVTRGYWLRSTLPPRQVEEVMKRFGLHGLARPFSRCMECNALIEPVGKNDIAGRVLPKTLRYYDDFTACTGCGKVYWKGSHYGKLVQMVNFFVSEGEDVIGPPDVPNGHSTGSEILS
jgi:hypothetical protein